MLKICLLMFIYLLLKYFQFLKIKLILKKSSENEKEDIKIGDSENLDNDKLNNAQLDNDQLEKIENLDEVDENSSIILNDNKSIEFKKRIQEINVELSTIPELDINNLYETNENIQVLKNLKPPLNNKIYVAEKLSLKEQIQEKIEIDQDINILEE